MELGDEITISAPVDVVWTALNDADVLRRSLNGCTRLERIEDDQFEMEITAKLGPVKAKFKGSLEMTDIKPGEAYTLTGLGKGGVAGFARGSAQISLHAQVENDIPSTLLRYVVKVSVGGKIAQLGSRLIDGAARKITNDFFATFVTTIEETLNVSTGDCNNRR